MHEYGLLEILAAGFTLALILGYITNKLKLSPIVGYLLAGFLIGPFTPGFVGDMALAHQLSEVGVILLMFSVGLHFNLKDLLAVKGISIPGAILQSTASTLCGVLVAHIFGMTYMEGIILGIGLAVASTVVLLRVLTDNNMLDTVHGHVAVGWLVMEDIITVFVLVLIPTIAGISQGQDLSGASIGKALGGATLRIVLLWIIVLVLGGKFVPWLLTKIARTRSEELFTLTILVAAFVTAVGAALIFNASMALGAFLGGMVVGRSSLHHQAGANILPLKDAFAVLFFISVGMLFSPRFLMENLGLVLACLGIVLVVKPAVAIVVVSVLGYSARTALTVGAGLAQIGEFSFILAQQAQAYQLVQSNVYYILVVCALISITFNPVVFRHIDFYESVLKKSPFLWKLLNFRADRRGGKFMPGRKPGGSEDIKSSVLAVVVGYGPTGKDVVKVFEDHGVTPSIIDFNIDTVKSLSDGGRYAIYGDASKKDILKAAGIEKAQYLVLTVPNTETATATIILARSLNPGLRIFGRVRFLSEVNLMKEVGSIEVAVEEQEVAYALSDLVLNDIKTYN